MLRGTKFRANFQNADPHKQPQLMVEWAQRISIYKPFSCSV